MKKKCILFDWGNIVESHHTGYSCYKAWDDLLKKCGYKEKVSLLDFIHKYHLNYISNMDEFEKVFEKMSKDNNFIVSFSEFIDLYRSIFSKIDYYKDVALFEESLKDKCYIGIFSNLCFLDRERLEKQVDLEKYDYLFFSYELGLEKPDLEIFLNVSKKLPFDKKDILFVDDSKDNIDMAKKIGWNTLLCTGLDLDKIKDECLKFIGGK